VLVPATVAFADVLSVLSVNVSHICKKAMGMVGRCEDSSCIFAASWLKPQASMCE
jgi:hypothetical protein